MLAGAPDEQTATAARVLQFHEWVGWVESKRMTVGSFEPSQSDSFSLPLIHSVLFQALHYCLPWQAVTGRGPSAGVCATC